MPVIRPLKRRGWPAAAVILAVGLAATACGDGPAAGESDGRGAASARGGDELVVVTTVAPITSIVANVVGDRARIVGIVPEGTNSHTFEPKPSVAEVLSEADVLFMNGLQLEEPTKELAEANTAEGTEIVELGNETISPEEYLYDFSFPEEEGKPNPHLWTNPPMAERYAEIVAERMAELDPAGADAYAANLAAFSAKIGAFDEAMRTAFATIPADQRKLLTYHDAYAYFAEEYDWEVIGAIQVSDFEDPTAKEVAELIEQVRATRVQAIFGSEVFPSPVLAQIGEETGVTYVDVLRDDDLPGAPGEAEHSWMGLMRFDFVTMTAALGGDPAALEQLDVSDVVPDAAEYPQ
jgi:ABC-type Zn uptake system ZnuABC Zn-binding protein ZnuA